MKLLRRIVIALLIVCFGGIVSVLWFFNAFYRADSEAEAAMKSDSRAAVIDTDYGWLFDGPSEECAMIFYGGAAVDERAYAPLLHEIAAKGMDVCLLRCPMKCSMCAPNRAKLPLANHQYRIWVIGGHSLGGVTASRFVKEHRETFSGILFLGSYPYYEIPSEVRKLSVIASNDGVIDTEKLAYYNGKYLTDNSTVVTIEGGNHGQFGYYGKQFLDNDATISHAQQTEETVSAVEEYLIKPLNSLPVNAESAADKQKQ